MLSENREFEFDAESTIKKSRVFANLEQFPSDDKVNWLFLEDGKRQISFVYKFKDKSTAKYDAPFLAALAFTGGMMLPYIRTDNLVC